MPAPRQPDHQHEEVDPTGIRDLLASLPDPGPMPEDLVRRIEARLEAERAGLERAGVERAPGSATGPHPWSPTGDMVGTASQDPAERSSGTQAASAVSRADNVFDLAAERSHRRPLRTVGILGAAAAGLLVTTVAVTQFMGVSGNTGGADTAASYPSLRSQDGADSDDADSGGTDDSAAAEALDAAAEDFAAAEEDAAGAGELAESDSGSSDVAADEASDADAEDLTSAVADDPVLGGGLRVLADLGPVTPEDLGTIFRAALADDRGYAGRDLSLEESRTCWELLAGEHSFIDHLTAPAQFVPSGGDGEAAIALLGLQEDGSGQAWIMPAGCAQDASLTPLSGPHPVD